MSILDLILDFSIFFMEAATRQTTFRLSSRRLLLKQGIFKTVNCNTHEQNSNPPWKKRTSQNSCSTRQEKTQEFYETGSEHLGGIVFSCSRKINSEDYNYLIAAKEDGSLGEKVSLARAKEICKNTGNVYFLPKRDMFELLSKAKTAGIVGGFNACNDGDFFYWISTSSEDGSSQVMDIRDGSCKKCQPNEEHRFHLVRRGWVSVFFISFFSRGIAHAWAIPLFLIIYFILYTLSKIHYTILIWIQ